MPSADQGRELGGFGAEGDQRPFHRAHLELDRYGAGVVTRLTRDGRDYAVWCERHQGRGPWVTDRLLLGVCPKCAAEIEWEDWRLRYRLWHATAAAGR